MKTPMAAFWALSTDQQRVLAIAHGVDVGSSPYSTPFENARYLMFVARQNGQLDAMLTAAATMA